MAACNALFWDAEQKRWDGSEEIMVRSRAWITKIPEKPHVRLLSASFLNTMVLTFQGIQVMDFIIEGLLRRAHFSLISLSPSSSPPH